jgi:uncharacterized membrane protein YgcG
MATSPASPEAEGAGSPGRDRADFPSSRRRISRWVIRVLLLAVALLAFSTPAFAATHAPHAARATAARATLTASLTPAVPGGVCQVPGIGDIGGLVGLCTQGSSGIVGDLNNICEPSLPQPEQATAGIDAMVEPPAAAPGGNLTLYDNYGVAGQFWAAHGLQCSDMTSLIGNNVAGMVFDAAKSVDRVTITVYQSAAGNNILTWLQNAVDGLISALGNAIFFPYLAPVVILGAIWLAWQGLIRKRATRTIEGTLWMVVACVAAIALIGRPATFTGVGTTVSNGVTEVLNTAFSKLPAPANSNCLPVQQGDPQAVAGDFAYTSGNALVDENANELWAVLVCKPWLYGELGTTQYNPAGQPPTVVNTYGRQLLWAQAIAANETPSTALIQAKQATYTGIATSMQQNDPAVYPLFQGNQWTTRLEISFASMFAALVAGLLILLIALTLIVLKLGFLLLLVAGPFFLIIGIHPGFGRVVAIRWFEMLVGVLMKQVAIAIVLSVLLYCYSLIMGQSDAVLPWALKILMISLVTVAVFIYRKPFAHLFSAVGYGTIGSTERAEYSLREAGATFRRSTLDAATVAVPGMAGSRAARWARRNPGQAAAVAAGAAAGVAAGGVAAGGAAAADGAAGAGAAQAGSGDGYASRLRPDTPPPADEDGEVSSGSSRVGAGVSGTGAARAKNLTEADAGSGRVAPPLDLPPRTGRTPATAGTSSAPNGSAGSSRLTGSTRSAGNGGSAGSSGAATGWSRGAGHSAGTGAQPRTTASGGSAPPVRGQARSGSRGSAPPINGPANGAANGRAGGSGPAWPGSGWATAGARQRSGSGPRPNPSTPPPAEPAGQGGQPSNGRTDEPRAMPFWLRPIRRDK